MKTYIVILITVLLYSRALDGHEGDRSKNNDEVIVLTPEFENNMTINISTAENKDDDNSDNKETTPPTLCAICDPTANLKDDNGKLVYKNTKDDKNRITDNTKQIVSTIGNRDAFAGDDCSFGRSRADDGNCLEEE